MSRIIKALLAMAAMAAFVLVASAPAQADGVEAQGEMEVQGTLYGVYVPNKDNPAGMGMFLQDGDKLAACDEKSDGYYVKAYLDIDQDGDYDRSATTKGHKAGYCSDWVTGNIAEPNNMDFWVCTLYDGHWKDCSGRYEIKA